MEEIQSKKQRLLDCPVIAAVKDEAGLQAALQSECEVIFLLFGTVLSVAGLVEQVRAAGKLAIVHIDLVDGLSQREVAVDGLARMCAPDGIISTKPTLVRRARHLGMLTVQRAFILDSLALSNLPAQLGVLLSVVAVEAVGHGVVAEGFPAYDLVVDLVYLLVITAGVFRQAVFALLESLHGVAVILRAALA